MKTFRMIICLLAIAGALLAVGPETVHAAPPMNGPVVHIVRWGENLTRLAAWYGVSVYDIAQANHIADPNRIYVGQRLVIPLTPAPVPTEGIQYVVQVGDTLSGLAVAYRTTVTAIVQANRLVNPSYIYVGQVLTIPTQGGTTSTTGVYYTVRAGDTLAGIAYRYGVNYWSIVQANNLPNPSRIYVGQSLFIPGGIAPADVPTATPTPTGEAGDDATATPTVTPGGPTATATPTVTPGGPTPTPTATWDPNSCTPPPPDDDTSGTSAGECPIPTATVIPAGPVPLPSPFPPKSLHMASPEYGMSVNVWGMGNCITDRDLRLVKEAGFTWVRQVFPWRAIEKRNDEFNWDEADRIVGMAAKYELDLAVAVAYQPEWAGGGYPLNGPPRNMADFKHFMTELSRRYKGLVRAYEIWPGPNVSENWGGQSPDPYRYAEMLIVGYWGVKEQDPFAMVISGGLVQTALHDHTAKPPIEFFKVLYEETEANQASDVWGVEALGFRAAPENSPQDLAHPDLNNYFPATAELNTTWGFRSVEVLYDYAKVRPLQKQFVVTKMGWTTDPNERSWTHWAQVSEEVKADHLRRAYRWAKDNWSDWMGVMFVPLTDARLTMNDEDYWWSVVDPNGCPRYSYNVLKDMSK